MRIPIQRLNLPKDNQLTIGGVVRSNVSVGKSNNDADAIEWDTELQLFLIYPVNKKFGEVLVSTGGAGYTSKAALASPAAPAAPAQTTVKPGAK